MKLTKRKTLYAICGAIIIGCIIIQNVRNSQPYTGLWGFNGGSSRELVAEKLSAEGFHVIHYSNRIRGINRKGVLSYWGAQDLFEEVECVFNSSNQLVVVKLTKWEKPNYAPSLIKDLEDTFGETPNGNNEYTGNNWYMFGKPNKTHATLNVSDNPPITLVSIYYDIRE